jgi:hypothetical protein
LTTILSSNIREQKMKLLKRLWRDESGVVHTTDVILGTTLLVIGSIVGLVILRNQIVQELGDIGAAVGHLDQSYEFPATSFTSDAGTFSHAGSDYEDLTDACQTADVANEPPCGMSVTTPIPNMTSTHDLGEE